MKRMILLFLCLIPLAGCTLAEAQAGELEPSPDPYALEEGQTELYGKVRTAFGNEVTVAVGTLDSGGPGGDAGEGGFPSGEGADRELPGGGERGGMEGGQGGSSGGFPGGEGGGPEQMAQGMPRQQSGGMGGGLSAAATGGYELTYTGREETFLIPVTATVVNGTGENAATVRFTQISEKSIVRIVLDENGAVAMLQILQ